MKIRVTFKMPDAVDDAIGYAVKDAMDDNPKQDEEALVGAAKKACAKWFEYGEYVVVEVDTKDGTCVVLPA